MPVSIGMSVTETSVDTANNRSLVSVVVTAYYTGGSFNRNDPPLTVTLDGVSDTVNVDFNAGESTSGSETIYSKSWYIGHDSNGTKTLHYSASYVTGVSSGTVSTSGSLVLTEISTGSSGGGDSGDSGNSGETGEDEYYIVYDIGAHCKVYRSVNGGSPTLQSESGSQLYGGAALFEFTFVADEGYTLSECKLNGVPCSNPITVQCSTGTYTISCSAVANTSSTGVTNIDSGDGYTQHSIHIEDGTTWYEYEAYVDDGTSWYLYS